MSIVSLDSLLPTSSGSLSVKRVMKLISIHVAVTGPSELTLSKSHRGAIRKINNTFSRCRMFILVRAWNLEGTKLGLLWWRGPAWCGGRIVGRTRKHIQRGLLFYLIRNGRRGIVRDTTE